MITFDNVTLRRGKNVLLENINWTIYAKQRIGVIGKNGSGKSSLLSLIKGELEPDVGSLTIPSQLVIADVAQEHEASDKSAIEYVLQGDSVLYDLLQQLEIAEQRQDGDRVASLHEKIAIHDGYTANSRAAQLLVGLSFSTEDHQRAYKDFSGGWQMRLNLARALMAPSDILLLDEPTNHLDLDAVIWLEDWIALYPGTLILISHDRDFLDKTVDHIAYLTHQRLKSYTGNYSTFEENYANELSVQQATYEKQQKEIAHMQSFVDRFKAKATKAKQAQSRMKAIERMQKVDVVRQESPFRFAFKKCDAVPIPMITLSVASVGYMDHIVLKNLDMSFHPQDRIALIGPNGAGKSTFIKMLAGDVPLLSGIREIAKGLKVGYFAQHQVEHLDLNESAITHLQRLAPDQSEKELRTYLGTFGFVGDRVFEQVGIFSGGEKARLALSLIVWQKPNLLLLDEPTNHLDMMMREALSIALQTFEGAVLIVSHDRFLIRTTVNDLLLVANQEVKKFDGDLDDYEKWLREYRKDNSISQIGDIKESNKKEVRKRAAVIRQQLQPINKKIAKLENEIEKQEIILNQLESQLMDSELYEDDKKGELKECLLQQAQCKKDLLALEESWLSACLERDKLAEDQQ